ncbi:MAG: M16 family metallopeptidase [Pyrinomonadaceae bacterium]
MNWKRLASLALALALVAPSAALAQRRRGQTRKSPATVSTANTSPADGRYDPNSPLPPIRYTEFFLSNGLRVILHEDHSTPIVGVNMWYHVGSKNEVPGRTGFAHLFEHMMFQGSQGYDDEYFNPIQEAGGTLNGSTNPDRTNYWEVVPSNFLDLALFLEADRLATLLDVLSEKKLANQRDVVKNEKRQNYDNRPYGLVGAKIAETIYPKDHPYHWLTIGSLEDLSNASIDDVKDFFRRYYTPNNASLAIAGDINPAEARRLAEKYFGHIARGPEVKPVIAKPPVIKETKRMSIEDRVALPRLYQTWVVQPRYNPDEAPLDALAAILAGGKTSRLYKTLVYDRQIAQDVSAFNNAQELAGVFQIVATAKPGKTLAELEQAINEEIEKIRQEPPTREEVERVYNATEAGFIYGLQTVGGFGGRNDQLNQYATYLNDPGHFQKDLARYRAVMADDVRRVAQNYLTDKRLVTSVTPRARGNTPASGAPVPEGPARAGTSPSQQTAGQPQAGTAAAGSPVTGVSADRPAGAQAQTKTEAAATQPAGAAPPTTTAARPEQKEKDARALAAKLPKPKADPRFQLPQIQRRKLSNGLDVLIVEHHELPVVSMNLIVKTGAAADRRERTGLAGLTAGLLDEGTSTRSSLDISNQLASIGAQLGTDSGRDSSGVTLRTLTRQLDKALEIYADVITNPAFPGEELERARSQRLAQFAQLRDNADAIAGIVFPTLLYGRTHPYGQPAIGDEASVRAVMAADARSFYETYYRPNNSTLIVVGDVRPATLVPKLERAFANWKGGDVPTLALPEAPARQRAAIYIVDRPGAAQSVISIGHVGVARSTPDYFPLLVMNTLLGGQFSSRVNLNLREDKGYTYGARTSFDFRRSPGPFTASAGVQTAVTKESVQEFLKELRGIRGEIPVSPRELEFAKQALIRGYPRGFETPDQIAGRLSDVALYGLPADYFNTYIQRVRAVTAADVARVANKYLDPSRMAILVVGDRKVIEPGLRSIEDVGQTITLLDASGRTTTGDGERSGGEGGRQ